MLLLQLVEQFLIFGDSFLIKPLLLLYKFVMLRQLPLKLQFVGLGVHDKSSDYVYDLVTGDRQLT